MRAKETTENESCQSDGNDCDGEDDGNDCDNVDGNDEDNIKCATKRSANQYDVGRLPGIFREQAESIMYVDVGFKVTSHAMYSLSPSLRLLGPEKDEYKDVEGFACTFFTAFPNAAVVARLAKCLVRSVCLVRAPGFYIEFCVYEAAIDLGLVTCPSCRKGEWGYMSVMRSHGHMISNTCDPYQLLKKTASMLHKPDVLCKERGLSFRIHTAIAAVTGKTTTPASPSAKQ